MTPEQYQQWMQQWRHASVALEQVKREELARMTEAEALEAANDLLELSAQSYHDPRYETYSGLIEQQRILHKRRTV